MQLPKAAPASLSVCREPAALPSATPAQRGGSTAGGQGRQQRLDGLGGAGGGRGATQWASRPSPTAASSSAPHAGRLGVGFGVGGRGGGGAGVAGRGRLAAARSSRDPLAAVIQPLRSSRYCRSAGRALVGDVAGARIGTLHHSTRTTPARAREFVMTKTFFVQRCTCTIPFEYSSWSRARAPPESVRLGRGLHVCTALRQASHRAPGGSRTW